MNRERVVYKLWKWRKAVRSLLDMRSLPGTDEKIIAEFERRLAIADKILENIEEVQEGNHTVYRVCKHTLDRETAIWKLWHLRKRVSIILMLKGQSIKKEYSTTYRRWLSIMNKLLENIERVDEDDGHNVTYRIRGKGKDAAISDS